MEVINQAELPHVGKSDATLQDLVMSFTVFRSKQSCMAGLTLVQISL